MSRKEKEKLVISPKNQKKNNREIAKGAYTSPRYVG
jgi:hypothetical protein